MSGTFRASPCIGGYQAITSTNTTQGGGLITGAVVQLTCHLANGAFTLPAGQPQGARIVLLNTAASGFAAAIFPPVAVVSVSGPTTWNGQINEAAANAAVSLPSGKTAICEPVPDITGQRWLMTISA